MIKRWWIYIRDGEDYNECPDGDWVDYEDHLVETSRLEHIIAGANAEIERLALALAKIKKERSALQDLVYELQERVE
mgnify:FL=1